MTSPNKEQKPTIPDVIDLFVEYYKRNPVWGSLHIVLEDLNVKDKNVLFCKEFASEHNDPDGERLADILLTMSKSQRLRLRDKVDLELEKLS